LLSQKVSIASDSKTWIYVKQIRESTNMGNINDLIFATYILLFNHET